MKTVIYADILAVINIIVNYFLLRASAAITASGFKTLRFLAASALGGAFAFMIFVDGIPPAVNVLIKLAFSAVMVITAFGFVSLKAFMKRFAAFFLANFAFAGIMLAGCTFFFKNTVIYKNGAVYFDMDILTLTVSAIACYIILSVISRFTRSKTPPKSIYSVELSANRKSTKCRALFDTGNTLCDGFSGRPVIIADISAAEKLIPENARDKNGNTDYTAIKGFRLIPYSTVGGSGALPAFPIDEIRIELGAETGIIKNVYMAVTEKKIVSGAYSALLGAPIFESMEKERRHRDEKTKRKTEKSDKTPAVKAVRDSGGLYQRTGYPASSADGGERIGVSETP